MEVSELSCCGDRAIALPIFQEAYRTYKDPFVLALALDVNSRKDIGTCVASTLA